MIGPMFLFVCVRSQLGILYFNILGSTVPENELVSLIRVNVKTVLQKIIKTVAILQLCYMFSTIFNEQLQLIFIIHLHFCRVLIILNTHSMLNVRLIDINMENLFLLNNLKTIITLVKKNNKLFYQEKLKNMQLKTKIDSIITSI